MCQLTLDDLITAAATHVFKGLDDFNRSSYLYVCWFWTSFRFVGNVCGGVRAAEHFFAHLRRFEYWRTLVVYHLFDVASVHNGCSPLPVPFGKD